MKGIAVWILAILTGLFIVGLSVYSLVTSPPALPHGSSVPGAIPSGDVSGDISSNDNVKNPIDIGSEAAGAIPWDSLRDYFFGGLFGVLEFISKYIIKPSVEFIASTIAQRSIIVPDLLGYILTALVVLLVFWKLWGQIWEFVASKWVLVLFILIFVFAAGIIMLYMGVI